MSPIIHARGQIHPAALTDAGCRPDCVDYIERDAGGDADQTREIARIDAQRLGDHFTGELPVFELLSKARPFNKAEVGAGIVFLPLSNDQFLVGQVSDGGLDL